MTPNISQPLSKEAFFRDILVPTGQVLEVMLKLVSDKVKADAFVLLAQAAFEPLNLASCYAINPDNTSLVDLAPAVAEFRNAMVKIIRDLGPAYSPHVAATLGARVRLKTATAAASTVQALAKFQFALPGLVKEIHDAIGYSAAMRSKWLFGQARVATPLTRDGTTNKWRTFVRNTSWQRCIEMLDIKSHVYATHHVKNAFTNTVGVLPAEILWRETFTDELPSAVVGEGGTAAAVSSRLPLGVTVKSTIRGDLQVEADFEPKKFLDTNQAKALAAPKFVPSDAVKDALAVRHFRQVCDVLSLAETVNAASAWLEAQQQTKAALLALYEKELNLVRLKAVRDKLIQHFNEGERRLLAEYFACQAQPKSILGLS